MDYMREYEKWLASPALTPEEHAELESICGDEKEIRERFYGPLEFGTAGLRGTMKVGLHQMNVHVIRWATQGFANVICAEGEEAPRNITATRSIGPTAPSCRLSTPPPSPGSWSTSTFSPACAGWPMTTRRPRA